MIIRMRVVKNIKDNLEQRVCSSLIYLTICKYEEK